MRKLSLKKETLVELSPTELDSIVGAQAITKQSQCFCSDFASCFPTAYNCPTETLRAC
jgi:hypothetical protein